jgi:hypothetical protein
MKKLFALAVLQVACLSLLWVPTAKRSQNDEAEIRQLLDRWAKAVRSKDLPAVMSIYEPGEGPIAYDIVPPLQYCVDSTHIKKTIRNFSTGSRVAMILNIEP